MAETTEARERSVKLMPRGGAIRAPATNGEKSGALPPEEGGGVVHGAASRFLALVEGPICAALDHEKPAGRGQDF